MAQERITRQIQYASGHAVTLEALLGRCRPTVVAGPAVVVECFWGELRVRLPELGVVPMVRGDLLTWPGGNVEVVAGPGAIGLVVHGEPAAVRRMGSEWDEPSWNGDTLVANLQHLSAKCRAAWFQVVRRMRDGVQELDPARVPGFLDNVAAYRENLRERLASSPGRTLSSRQRSFERLMRARLQVLIQPQRKWTLAEMAAAARYSPWHFQRAFVSTFQQSPHDFVQEVRLRLGRRLLAQPHLSVADVAAAIGYESQSNFTRIFKQQHGVTAHALRRGIHRGGRVAAHRDHGI